MLEALGETPRTSTPPEYPTERGRRELATQSLGRVAAENIRRARLRRLPAEGSVQPEACRLWHELGRERQTCRKLVLWALRKASMVAFMGSTQYSWDSLRFSMAHSRAAKCPPGAIKKAKYGRPEVGRATRVE